MKFTSLSFFWWVTTVSVLLTSSTITVEAQAQNATTPAPIIDDTSMPQETIAPVDGGSGAGAGLTGSEVCQDAAVQWTTCFTENIGTACSADCLTGLTGLADWTGSGTGNLCDEFETTLCAVAGCCEACQDDFLVYANCLYADADLGTGTACSSALDCSGAGGGTPNGNNTNTNTTGGDGGGNGGGNGGGGGGGGGFDQILPECVSILSNYTQCFQVNLGTTCGADDNTACSGDVFAEQDPSVYPTCQQVEAAVCAFSSCCPPCQAYFEAYISCWFEYDPANVNNIDSNGCNFNCTEGGGGSGGNSTIPPDTTTTKAPSAAAATDAPTNAPLGGGGGDVPSSPTAEPTSLRITQSPFETPLGGGEGSGAPPTVPATTSATRNGIVSAVWSLTAAMVILAAVLV